MKQARILVLALSALLLLLAACTTTPDPTPTQQTLTVDLTGTGNGTVTATPAGGTGQDFSADGTETYAAGTVVTLTATPAADSTFDGWGGGCTGTGSCEVTMSQARTVRATFTLIPVTPGKASISVTVAGDGGGSVDITPDGGTTETCTTGTCTVEADPSTDVTLTATPDGNSTFDGFTGENCSTSPCTVTLGAENSSKAVTATFTMIPDPGNPTVTVALSGSNDDAEEYVDGKTTGTPNDYQTPGSISTNTSYIELGYSERHGSEQLVALRFPDVTIPAGATIVSAHVEVVARNDSKFGLGTAGQLPLLISVQNSFDPTDCPPADPATTACDFTDSLTSANGGPDGPINQISDRANTGTELPWTAPDLASWTADSVQQTADIKSLVEAWTSLTGWVNGDTTAGVDNAMVVMFRRNPSDSSQSARHFYDLDAGDATKGAKLVIEYTLP